MAYSELSEKGQVVIPEPLRRKFGLHPGSAVSIMAERDRMVIYPVGEDPIEHACGLLKGGESLADELLKERERDKKREQK